MAYCCGQIRIEKWFWKRTFPYLFIQNNILSNETFINKQLVVSLLIWTLSSPTHRPETAINWFSNIHITILGILLIILPFRPNCRILCNVFGNRVLFEQTNILAYHGLSPKVMESGFVQTKRAQYTRKLYTSVSIRLLGLQIQKYTQFCSYWKVYFKIAFKHALFIR